jgi:hypothetical protein
MCGRRGVGAMPATVSLAVVLMVVSLGLASAAVSSAAPGTTFVQVDPLPVGTFATYAMARSTDGTLHLVYQTTTGASSAPTGLATRTISPTGVLGPQVQALKGWTMAVPGLVELPGGMLETFFGAVSPKPKQISDVWGISSSNGGKSWTAPAQVGAGGADEAQAYGANVRAEVEGSKPVLSLAVAGGIVVQQGLGAKSPTASIVTKADDFAGDVDSALDAGTKKMVVSWDSNAGSGGDFIKGATGGPTVKVPGQTRNEVVISGRDSGPGIFAAYTTDGTSVRLARYGGGSVSVGSVSGVTAKLLGTATGLDGRIWVMWGDENGGVALTRSNRAVTRFEPIQRVDPHAFTLYRLGGDGRLGPLDLLVEMSKGQSGGTFAARVLPVLSDSTKSAAVKNKSGAVIAHVLTVTVSDAGDPVPGATVTVQGHHATTTKKGLVQVTLPGAGGTTQLTVTAPGYQTLQAQASI